MSAQRRPQIESNNKTSAPRIGYPQPLVKRSKSHYTTLRTSSSSLGTGSLRTTYHEIPPHRNVRSSTTQTETSGLLASPSRVSVATTTPSLSRRPSAGSADVRSKGPEVYRHIRKRSVSQSNLLANKDPAPLLPRINDESESDSEEGASHPPEHKDGLSPTQTELQSAFHVLSNTVENLTSAYQEFRDSIILEAATNQSASDEERYSALTELCTRYVDALIATLKSIDALPSELQNCTLVIRAREDIEYSLEALTTDPSESAPCNLDVQLLDFTMECIRSLLLDLLNNVYAFGEHRASRHERTGSEGQVVDFIMYDEAMESAVRNSARVSWTQTTWTQTIPESVSDGADFIEEIKAAPSRPPVRVLAKDEPLAPARRRPVKGRSGSVYSDSVRKSLHILDEAIATSDPPPLPTNSKLVKKKVAIGVDTTIVPRTATLHLLSGERFDGPVTTRLMVEYLCSSVGSSDTTFMETFFMCWRFLMTPHELLAHIAELYHESSAMRHDRATRGTITAPKAQSTFAVSPFFVVRLLNKWFNEWEPDVDGAVLPQVHEFIEPLLQGGNTLGVIKSISPMLRRMVTLDFVRKRRTQEQAEMRKLSDIPSLESDDERKGKGRAPPLRRGSTKSNMVKMFQREPTHSINPDDATIGYAMKNIVGTLTIMAVRLYRAIEPEDLLFEMLEGMIDWPNSDIEELMRERNEIHNAKVAEYDAFHNTVSRWAAYYVISEISAEVRAERRVFILKLIKHCVACRNYSVAHAMFLGITSRYNVNDLPLTKSYMKEKYRTRISQYEIFFSRENYDERLMALHETVCPRVPILNDYMILLNTIKGKRRLRVSKPGDTKKIMFNAEMLKDFTRVILVMEKTFQPAYDFPQDSFLEDFFTHTFEKLPSDEEVTSKRAILRLVECDERQKMRPALIEQVNLALRKKLQSFSVKGSKN